MRCFYRSWGHLIPIRSTGSAAVTQVAAVNGLVVQGSNLGIVLGPILISSVVARYGWSFAPAVAVTGALLGAVFVFALSRCKQTAFAPSDPAH